MFYVGLNCRWDAAVSGRVAALLERCQVPWHVHAFEDRAVLELPDEDERIALLVAELLRAAGLPAEGVDDLDTFMAWDRTYYVGLPQFTRADADAFAESIQASGEEVHTMDVEGVGVLVLKSYDFARAFIRCFPDDQQGTIVFEHEERSLRNRIHAVKQHGN